jgi:hypothetical protein
VIEATFIIEYLNPLHLKSRLTVGMPNVHRLSEYTDNAKGYGIARGGLEQ